MPPDQAIPVAETAHRLKNVEIRAFQVREMREHIPPDQILQVKVVGGLSPLMVAIGDRVEILALPFDEVVVFIVHFLAYGPRIWMLVPMWVCETAGCRDKNFNSCHGRDSIPISRIRAVSASREEFFRHIRREPRARAVAVPRSATRSRRRMSSQGPRDRASGISPGRHGVENA